MNIILQLIRVFFLIGAFSFGGGMASMEVIRSRVVTDNAWLTDSEFTIKGFKQMMNRWRYDLEELGVHYRDHRSNGTRLLEVKYIPSSAVSSDESAVSDVTNSV